uniref:Macrophage migration inhibitory factor n=1 Tax=Setaria digitata TaxID=48799 RepID=A0A915Q0S9_9BILA
MPLITVASNVPAASFPTDFNVQFTELMAEILGKPASRIVLLVTPNAQLTHGATQDSACLIVNLDQFFPTIRAAVDKIATSAENKIWSKEFLWRCLTSMKEIIPHWVHEGR